MSKFKRFEEIEAWKKARSLSVVIYKMTSTPYFQKDFSLINQIRRASGSIMDNIAEGFGREGNREFQQYLTIAKGSAFEVKSQLYRALDQQYILSSEFEDIYYQTDTICKLISGLLKYLRNSEFKGTKFKETPKTTNQIQSTENTELKTENRKHF
jgi:four helix bundle protein